MTHDRISFSLLQGTFFDQSQMSTGGDSDELLADPAVTTSDNANFRTIPTTGAIILSILFMVNRN